MPARSVDIDRTFRALADPSRRDFVSRLADGPKTVSELARGTDLTLAAVVQHVQALQASGLIATRKSGRVRICSLRSEALSSVEQWVATRRRTWERRFDALGDVLDEQVAPTGGQEHP